MNKTRMNVITILSFLDIPGEGAYTTSSSSVMNLASALVVLMILKETKIIDNFYYLSMMWQQKR